MRGIEVKIMIQIEVEVKKPIADIPALPCQILKSTSSLNHKPKPESESESEFQTKLILYITWIH